MMYRYIFQRHASYSPNLNNSQRARVINVGTPRFRLGSASAFVIWGKDENFFEWASADILIATLTGSFRPTEQLRADLGRPVLGAVQREVLQPRHDPCARAAHLLLEVDEGAADDLVGLAVRAGEQRRLRQFHREVVLVRDEVLGTRKSGELADPVRAPARPPCGRRWRCERPSSSRTRRRCSRRRARVSLEHRPTRRPRRCSCAAHPGPDRAPARR
mgnify:CR=1 FL=1